MIWKSDTFVFKIFVSKKFLKKTSKLITHTWVLLKKQDIPMALL